MLINDDIIPLMIDLVTGGKRDIQKEGCWTICNMICGASVQQLASILEHSGIVGALRTCLANDIEERLITIITESMERLMKVENRKK